MGRFKLVEAVTQAQRHMDGHCRRPEGAQVMRLANHGPLFPCLLDDGLVDRVIQRLAVTAAAGTGGDRMDQFPEVQQVDVAELVVVAELFPHLHQVVVIAKRLQGPHGRMVGLGERTVGPPLVQGEVVHHADILGPLHHPQQPRVLVLVPGVHRPVHMGVAADPTPRPHVDDALAGQGNLARLSRFQLQVQGDQSVFESTLQREGNFARRNGHLEGAIAVEKRQFAPGGSEDHRFLADRADGGIRLAVPVLPIGAERPNTARPDLRPAFLKKPAPHDGRRGHPHRNGYLGAVWQFQGCRFARRGRQ